jgi:hypothetical protein
MSAPPAPPPRAATFSKPARLLVAFALTALGFGAIVAGTIIIGGGRDFHAIRVVAALVFMLPVAITLVWREQTPLVRAAAALAALLLGAAAWWQLPCRIGGMNLLRATGERDELRSSMGLVTFDNVRLGRHFQKRIDDLATEYPSLAASLRPEFTRWGVDAEAAIVEKLRDTPANDIAGARMARARGRDLSQLFPDGGDGIESLFQSWAKSALQTRIDELNDLRLADWNGFDRTAASRRQLAQAFPDSRESLIAAEKAWVLRSASAATEPALQSLDTKPRQVSKVCGDLERRIRVLKGVQGRAEEFREARLALFFLAHEASCREVLLHIRAEQYLAAFTTANGHRIGWLKVPGLLGPNEKKLTTDLTEQARHLSIRFDKAGFVDIAPAPRSRETAPPPRTKQ